MATMLITGLLQAAAQAPASAPRPVVPVERTPATAPVVTAAMLYRWQPETNGLIHSHATEIYYILEGSGTLTTGGTLQDARANDLARLGAGVGQSGVHVGGTSRKIGPRDIAIVPGGMAHRFSQLDGPIKYLVFRFDPSQK